MPLSASCWGYSLIIYIYNLNYTVVYGPYWTHMKEAWTRREHPNLYFLFYEDMKEDPSAGIEHLSTFLGCSLTQKQIDDVCNVLIYLALSLIRHCDLGVL